MRFFRFIFLLGLFSGFFLHAKAQRLSVKELINAWDIGDTSQTTRAEATYRDLREHTDSAVFQAKMSELESYLQAHPSKRLEARITIYDIEGKKELSIPMTDRDMQQIKHAILLAELLGDRQLLSELYYLYAENIMSDGDNNLQDLLFYELKSIAIQQRIGFSHFPLVHIRFFRVSQAFYIARNYREAIRYGRQGLALLKSPKNNFTNYILLLDNVGAAYRMLGNADSTIIYYREIAGVLNGFLSNPSAYLFSYKYDQLYRPLDSKAYVAAWQGIASGGIGYGLFLKKDYNEARLLLLGNVQSSLATQQYGDAALAQDALAKICLARQQYDSALHRWKLAYAWALHDYELPTIVSVLHGIAGIYKQLGKYDSAYTYLDFYRIYDDTLRAQMTGSRLAAVNTRLGFDNMQGELREAQDTIDRQALFRKFLLGCLALLVIIFVLLYNRWRLRHAQVKKEKEIADMKVTIIQQQVSEARRQLDDFRKNIAEKNRLIASLEAQPDTSAGREAAQALRRFTILTNDDWMQFREAFEKAYPDFWEHLGQKMPGLTQNEQRFMALIKLGLDNKEIAAALGISPDSVRTIPYRIRKKFSYPDTFQIRTLAQDI